MIRRGQTVTADLPERRQLKQWSTEGRLPGVPFVVFDEWDDERCRKYVQGLNVYFATHPAIPAVKLPLYEYLIQHKLFSCRHDAGKAIFFGEVLVNGTVETDRLREITGTDKVEVSKK